MKSGPLILFTQEEIDAQASDPREIEWRAQEERRYANARPHCTSCGRFVRGSTLRRGYFGDEDPTGQCDHCGGRRSVTWERS